MGCSSSKSIDIKQMREIYKIEKIEIEEKKIDKEEKIDIDVLKDEPKPQFEKMPEESEKPNINFEEEEDENSSNF
jgi:hypothetical protein